MRVAYATCDVFSDTRFGGNPLAVIPDARGLDDRQMQAIAREFNYSETTFVLPAETGHTRRVRIFTPSMEVPFAGHPNVGTAFVLARCGALGALQDRVSVEFEEEAGIVPVSIVSEGGRVLRCEVEAPQRLQLGTLLDVDTVAAVLSLPSAAISQQTHPPLVASIGLDLTFVEVRDRRALSQIHIDGSQLEALIREAGNDFLHAYTRSGDDYDAYARMFAPSAGVPEDPATGSANCTLGGLLAHFDDAASGSFRYRISQGTEMGRPSRLEARAEKQAGRVTRTWIGGACVSVAQGEIELDDAGLT